VSRELAQVIYAAEALADLELLAEFQSANL
jgi:hypothetical protein